VCRRLAVSACLLGLLCRSRAALADEPSAPTPAELDTAGEVGPRIPPSYLSTALEELAFLGVQTAWYWGHDWNSGHEKFVWSNWRTRFTDVHDIVLDDDRFRTGAVGHPVAGTGYYLIARGNGFGVAGSAAITVVASTIWQFFSEWNEKPASNDLLVTPAAGWVIGEASHQLGMYFLDQEPGVVNCVGAALFSPVATINDARACRFGRHGRSGGRRWHRIDLDVGTQQTVFDSGDMLTEARAGATVLLTTNSKYQRPGTGRRLAGPGEWTALATDWTAGQGAVQSVVFHADSIALGDYWRRYDDLSGAGAPDGWGRLLAVGGSFDYASRVLPALLTDRIMSVGLIGPMFELAGAWETLELRARAAVYYGFAQVTSLAYPRVADALQNQFIRTTLRGSGYYYAQALLPSAEVEVRRGPLWLKLMGRAGEYWSLNSGDTNQSRITDHFSLHDARLFTAASLGVQPGPGPLRVALELASAWRDGALLGQRETTHEQTVGASLSLGL
jgi:hypothetical protein